VGEGLSPVLVRRAVVDREPDAVRRVVRLLSPILQAATARTLARTGHARGARDLRQEVEDLVQEVFSVLLADGGRRLLAWDPAKGAASTFFGLIARRTVTNVLVSRRRNPWTEEPTDAEGIEARLDTGLGLERRLDARADLRALGLRLETDLNERDRRLFRMLYIEQRDTDEVRTTLGIGANALSQARRRLGQRLRRLAGEVLGADGRSDRQETA